MHQLTCPLSDHDHEGEEHSPVAEKQENSHDHDDGNEQGPHGGTLLAVGDHVAHLELVHDVEHGSYLFYVYGEDLETSASPDEPPAINLKTDEGPKQIAAQARHDAGGSVSFYEARDPAFRHEGSEGQIAVMLDGKRYFLPLPNHHHHEADDDHDHEEEGGHVDDDPDHDHE